MEHGGGFKKRKLSTLTCDWEEKKQRGGGGQIVKKSRRGDVRSDPAGGKAKKKRLWLFGG